MKKTLLAFFPLLCLATAARAYDAGWYVDSGFPGEYPTGFSVVEDNVTLLGRLEMDKSLPRDVPCPLPKNAVFHQWNDKRPAKYITATPIQVLTVRKKFKVADTNLSFKKGDKIEVLRYLSEGEVLFRAKGTTFETSQDIFKNLSPVKDFQEDLWVEAVCSDNKVVAILMRDVFDAEGEYVPGLGSWSLGFDGYDSVHDIRPKAVKPAAVWATTPLKSLIEAGPAALQD